MKLFIINILVIFFTLGSWANTFEGKISIRKNTMYDTVFYSYLIKDNKVRVEEFDKDKNLRQVYIVDIYSKQVYAVKPSEKLYTEFTDQIISENNQIEYSIVKSDNFKKINGHICYQWRVKNTEKNTEVAYWVINNEFYFFRELLDLLSNIDNSYSFYRHIPESQGFFPILAVERTLLRKEKCRIEVTSIKSQDIPDKSFIIPDDYEIIKH